MSEQPTPEDIMEVNPSLSREQAEEWAAFAHETRNALVAYYGSMEAALRAPGTPWEQGKRELGLAPEAAPRTEGEQT